MSNCFKEECTLGDEGLSSVKAEKERFSSTRVPSETPDQKQGH